MDGDAAMISSWQAAKEVENLKHRVSAGRAIQARHKNKITKRLVYGHYRPYPKGPVKKDANKCRIVCEIHERYDRGATVRNVVDYLNF
jgi:hypothetical protein